MILLLCRVSQHEYLLYGVSQLDVAEQAFSQALRIYTTILPQGHDWISNSESISTERAVVLNNY